MSVNVDKKSYEMLVNHSLEELYGLAANQINQDDKQAIAIIHKIANQLSYEEFSNPSLGLDDVALKLTTKEMETLQGGGIWPVLPNWKDLLKKIFPPIRL